MDGAVKEEREVAHGETLQQEKEAIVTKLRCTGVRL